MENVPYTVYESAMARADKRFRSMLLLVFVLLFILFGTNAGWIVYECQYEDKVISAEQSGSGVNNVGGDGVSYGAEGND